MRCILTRGTDQALNRLTFCSAVDPSHDEFNKKVFTKICEIQLKHMKNSKEALLACDRAIAIDENYGDALVNRAKVLDAEENFEEALRAWQRAREVLGEGNAQANDGYSRAEAALKQSKEKNYYKILGVGRQADKRKSRKRIKLHSNGIQIRLRRKIRKRQMQCSQTLARPMKSYRMMKSVANTIVAKTCLKTKVGNVNTDTMASSILGVVAKLLRLISGCNSVRMNVVLNILILHH